VRRSAHMPYLPQKNSVMHVSKSNNRSENLAKGFELVEANLWFLLTYRSEQKAGSKVVKMFGF